MILFSGTLEADDLPGPMPVKGSIRRKEKKDEGGRSYPVFSGILIATTFRRAGFWDFELKTDIGYHAFIKVLRVTTHFQGQLYLLHWKTVGSPYSLPSDGTLGKL
jgi:hypothetical protein